MLSHWNGAGFITQTIRMNKPAVWTVTDGPRKGQKVLVEPFIENYVKFNSNTGWVGGDGGSWNELVQAISHYYHITSGTLLLCDMQGGSAVPNSLRRRFCFPERSSDERVLLRKPYPRRPGGPIHSPHDRTCH
jgi:hypothetical protein